MCRNPTRIDDDGIERTPVQRLDILILGINYTPEHSGIAPYTRGMAQALSAAGHDVHVVTAYPHYPQWKIPPGYHGFRMSERDGDVRVTRVRQPIPSNPTGPGRIVMEAAFTAATMAVRHKSPDVILTVSPALLSVGAALARRRCNRKRPALGVVIQDLYASVVAEAGVLGGRGGGPVAMMERTLLRGADGVVAAHDAFRSTLSAHGVDPERVSVIRNWTHTSPPSGDAAALRRRLGWPADRTVALHAGNMGAKQGLESVIAAARRADHDQLPIEFVLMGDGSQRTKLETFSQGCHRVRFQDPLPDGEFETALAAADVLVLNERSTVRQMAIPSKLTSYFAAGRPVVAATHATSPAAGELHASGAGEVIEPDRPDLMVNAVRRLGGPDGAEMGRRGRAFAETAYAAETAQKAYVDWVERLAGEVRAAR